EIGSEIEAGDGGSGVGGGDGLVAGATGDVEDLHAGLEAEAGDKFFGSGAVVLGDFAEVASHPCGFHARFEFLETCGLRRHSSPHEKVGTLCTKAGLLRAFA